MAAWHHAKAFALDAFVHEGVRYGGRPVFFGWNLPQDFLEVVVAYVEGNFEFQESRGKQLCLVLLPCWCCGCRDGLLLSCLSDSASVVSCSCFILRLIGSAEREVIRPVPP